MYIINALGIKEQEASLRSMVRHAQRPKPDQHYTYISHGDEVRAHGKHGFVLCGPRRVIEFDRINGDTYRLTAVKED